MDSGFSFNIILFCYEWVKYTFVWNKFYKKAISHISFLRMSAEHAKWRIICFLFVCRVRFLIRVICLHRNGNWWKNWIKINHCQVNVKAISDSPLSGQLSVLQWDKICRLRRISQTFNRTFLLLLNCAINIVFLIGLIEFYEFFFMYSYNWLMFLIAELVVWGPNMG